MTYGMKEWIFYDNIKLTDYYEIKYIRNVKYKEWYKNEYTNLKKNNKIIEYILMMYLFQKIIHMVFIINNIH